MKRSASPSGTGKAPAGPEPRPASGPAAFWRGMRDSLALPAWVVGLSVLGIGSLAHDIGHPAGAAVLSTLLIWASPAQVILYGGLAVGTALPALAVVIGLSSIRFLPMTISLLPLLRRPGQGIALQLLIAHFVAITVWTESLRRLPAMPVEERLAYYFGFATTTIGISALLTGLGYFLAGTVPVPIGAGLLFLTPVFFTMTLSAGARTVADWGAIVLGFALAPIFTGLIGRDFDLLATGLVGGTAAYLLGRRQRRVR